MIKLEKKITKEIKVNFNKFFIRKIKEKKEI